MEKLKSCPFCGAIPIVQKDVRFPRNLDTGIKAFEVICTNLDCPIYFADNTYFKTEKEAIKAWNRRTGK